MAKYSIEFKEKVVKHYRISGISDTLRVYNISAVAVYKWIRQSGVMDLWERQVRDTQYKKS